VEEKEIKDELASIRSLMERSSKFISLSGLSGILAGVYALIGAAAAYYLLTDDTKRVRPYGGYYSFDHLFNSVVGELLIIAVLVFVASVASGIILTSRKAKRKGQAIWGSTSKALLFNMGTPLVAGALLLFIFILRGYYGIVGPSSLIFYGLALVGAGNFTFTMVKYLGLCEIAIGLIAACLPGYGLLFWAIGFGVLHIVYGSMMYLKYDR
jgi:predicted lysophospholipase L1 biosynthesis ABC-type transport system permease subunit